MSPRRRDPHPTQPDLTTMNAQTEQKLIDHLYECVNVHPHQKELIQLMQDQVNDLNSDKYWMLQEDADLLSSCT